MQVRISRTCLRGRLGLYARAWCSGDPAANNGMAKELVEERRLPRITLEQGLK